MFLRVISENFRRINIRNYEGNKFSEIFNFPCQRVLKTNVTYMKMSFDKLKNPYFGSELVLFVKNSQLWYRRSKKLSSMWIVCTSRLFK